MSSVNLYTKEISLKIVYYGPGLGGKTSSLQFIHRAIKPDARGQLVSLSTGVDRTLYFDFLPVKLPKLRGYTVRVQLYTVPGQVHYNSTRKLVLTGADGIVFVADSQRPRREANVESFQNLGDNLREQGLSLERMPHLVQYNKRDMPDLLTVQELDAALNPHRAPTFETSATRGVGVFEALKSITTLVLSDCAAAASGAPTARSRPRRRRRRRRRARRRPRARTCRRPSCATSRRSRTRRRRPIRRARLPRRCRRWPSASRASRR